MIDLGKKELIKACISNLYALKEGLSHTSEIVLHMNVFNQPNVLNARPYEKGTDAIDEAIAPLELKLQEIYSMEKKLTQLDENES